MDALCLTGGQEVRQGRSRMHVDVVHDFNKDRNRLVKTMHVRKATVHVQKEQVRNVHTLARSARGKALLPARCALHSQTCSSLAKLLPGNLGQKATPWQTEPVTNRLGEKKMLSSISYPWPGRKA